MRLQKIGDFVFKGSHGFYVEAVDQPRDVPRYAAIGFECLEDAEIRKLRDGEIIVSPVLDADPARWLHSRIDTCLG